MIVSEDIFLKSDSSLGRLVHLITLLVKFISSQELLLSVLLPQNLWFQSN